MYICRTWTKTAIDGWTSDFESFETKAEAIEYGETRKRIFEADPEELEIDYEVTEV